MLNADALDLKKAFGLTSGLAQGHTGTASEKYARSAAGTAAGKMMKIMIADDSPVYRKIIEDALCAMPFQRIFASSGRQALELYAKHRPDIIILDRVMPDFTGPEFCRCLQAISPDALPYIIMLTGSTDKASVVEGLDAGADDYVTKPFNDEELLARVRVGVRNRELHKQVQAKNKLLEELALSDPLTGLPNRRAIENWATRELESATRHDFPFWVVIADIDRFKYVNDTFGHAAGDTVLQEFSRILRANSRSSEICGRLGGEEFVSIFTHASREGVMTAVERIRMELEMTPFRLNGCDVVVTASFGIAGLGPDDRQASLSQLIASADSALYAAKRAGRNRVEVASK